jgi:hypothetical protein
MIATQRIEQLEMELQRNNAKPQQEYPHVQYPQNQNAYRNEAADMKVWFLEQKLRQLELDVHRNNTELLMMKFQPPQGRRQAPMPRYYNQTLFCCNSISSCSILCVAIIFDLCNSLFFPSNVIEYDLFVDNCFLR